MRPDSLIGEPIIVSSPTQSAEVAIVSMILETNPTTVDMMIDNLKHIGSMAYLYFFIVTIWTLVIINFRVLGSLPTQSTKRGNSTEVSIKVSKSTWHILELLVNQENWTLSLTFQKTMWLFYCVGYFVLIFGFLMNLMSTDQTVSVNAKQIDSLDDLLYQDSSKDRIVAVLIKELYLYDRLKNARKGSKLNTLYDLMNKTASYSFVTMPTSQVDETKSMKVISDLFDRKAVFLQSKSVVNSLTMTSACITNPTEAGKFYISKNTFAHGTLNSMLNKRTEPRLKAYLKYRHTNAFEMGLVGEMYKHMVRNLIFAFIQMTPSDTTYKCLDSMGKENQIPGNEPLKIINFRKLRHCCVISLITALLVLSMEASNSFRPILVRYFRSIKKSSRYVFRLCLKLWKNVHSYFKETYTFTNTVYKFN